MRAVDGGRPSGEDGPRLVRAADAPRPEDDLPALLHAPGGREEVDPIAAAVELRSFDRRVAGSTLEDRRSFADDGEPVVRKASQRQDAVEAGAALRPGVDEPERPVGIAERTRIDPPFRLRDEARRLPRTARVAGSHDEDPEVGVAVPDLPPASVVSDRRGPDAPAVPRDVVPGRRKAGRRVSGELPADEVLRAQEREARHLVEARRDEPVLVAGAGHVGVGPVGEEDRIPVDGRRRGGARLRPRPGGPGRRRGEEDPEKEAPRDGEGSRARARAPPSHSRSLAVVIPLCRVKSWATIAGHEAIREAQEQGRGAKRHYELFPRGSGGSGAVPFAAPVRRRPDPVPHDLE